MGGRRCKNEFGEWSGGFGESILFYFNPNKPSDEVCKLFCDSGDKEKKLRAKICNAAYKCMAVDFATHSNYGKLGYLVLC